jgi:hypothetical protein
MMSSSQPSIIIFIIIIRGLYIYIHTHTHFALFSGKKEKLTSVIGRRHVAYRHCKILRETSNMVMITSQSDFYLEKCINNIFLIFKNYF